MLPRWVCDASYNIMSSVCMAQLAGLPGWLEFSHSFPFTYKCVTE